MHKAGWITDTVTSYIRFCKDMFAHQTTRTKNPGLQQNSSSFDIPRRKPTELGMESCSHFQSTKNELLGKVGKKIFQPSTLRECGKAFRTPPATGDPQCLHLRHLICSTFRIPPLLAFLLHPRHSVKHMRVICFRGKGPGRHLDQMVSLFLAWSSVASQLDLVFTKVISRSLHLCVVHSCFKVPNPPTPRPIPKKVSFSWINYWIL